MSSSACSYLIAVRAAVSHVELAQLGERLHRRRRPERRQPCVEVALHPVLEHHRAVVVLALRVVSPPHVLHARKFCALSGSTMLGMSAGSTMTAPALAGCRSPRPSPSLAARRGRRAACSRPAASRDRRRTRAARRCARPSARRPGGTSCSRGRAAADRPSSPHRADRAAAPSSAPSRIAASVTVRAIGPGVS